MLKWQQFLAFFKTFISRINYRLLWSKPKNSIYLGYFGIYEQFKFYAQQEESFITSGPGDCKGTVSLMLDIFYLYRILSDKDVQKVMKTNILLI